MTFPTKITAGDTCNFTLPEVDFKHADSWVMKVQLVIDKTNEINITGEYTAGEYVFAIPASQTAELKAGKYYRLTQCVEKGEGENVERHSLSSIMIQVVAGFYTDISAAQGLASRILEKIELVLEGRATTDVLKYEIRGRSLERMDTAELIKWRKYWQLEVKKEEAAASGETFGPRRYRMTLR